MGKPKKLVEAKVMINNTIEKNIKERFHINGKL